MAEIESKNIFSLIDHGNPEQRKVIGDLRPKYQKNQEECEDE
jgi:hypothetical protein